MTDQSQAIAIANERLFTPFTNIPDKKTPAVVIVGGGLTTGLITGAAAEERHNPEDPRFLKMILAGGAPVFDPWTLLVLILDGNKEIYKLQSLKDIFSSELEADYMESVLRAANVPETDIIIGDNKEQHTDKIIANLIKSKVLNDFESATVVAYASHMRQALGTMRHQGIKIPLVPFPVNPFGLTPDNWHLKKNMRNFVLRQSENMNPKNKEGYIGLYADDLNIKKEQALIATLPDLKRTL